MLLFLAGRLRAQTELTYDSDVHGIEYSGTYADFRIPTGKTKYQAIFLFAKGGDGGFAKVTDTSPKHDKTCYAAGGEGAHVYAVFPIGSSAGALEPGSTLRFISADKGDDQDRASIFGSTAAGGGGGGSAVLYKAPGSSNWQPLLVAGGGGGAYQGVAFGSCVDGHDGGGGQTTTDGSNGRGSLAGSGGNSGGGSTGGGSIGDGDLSGGGGGKDANGKGGSDMEGKKGENAGGSGGEGQTNGGYGYGGGGAADESGGGGGGYSGGGGGGMTGSGGGGGSYLNKRYAVDGSKLIVGGKSVTIPTLGYTGYRLQESVEKGLENYGSLFLIPAEHPEYALQKSGDVLDTSNDLPLELGLRNPDDLIKRPNQIWFFDPVSDAIRLAADPSKCIDVKSSNTANGTPIQLHDCNGTAAQQWTIFNGYLKSGLDDTKCLVLNNNSFAEGTPAVLWDCSSASIDTEHKRWAPALDALKYPVIRLKKDKAKCIDVKGGSTSNNANIQLWGCNGNESQDWVLDGLTVRYAKETSKCLDLEKNKEVGGTNIQLYDCNGTKAQEWIYDGLSEKIRLAENWAYCLDLYQSSNSSGTNVQLGVCNGIDGGGVAPGIPPSQQWMIDGATTPDMSSNVKTIRPASYTDKCIYNSKGGLSNGNNILVEDCQSGNENQQWQLDGTTIKLAGHPDKCLDLASSNTANGTNIQLYDCNDTNAQKWIFDGVLQAFRSGVNPDKCMAYFPNPYPNSIENIALYDCNGSVFQRFLIE